MRNQRRPEKKNGREKRAPFLGYETLERYLTSTAWSWIEREALNIGRTCAECGDVASDVFLMSHTNATLRGQLPDNLICLCEKHYRCVCYSPSGFKVGRRRKLKAACRTLQNRLVAKQRRQMRRRSRSRPPDWGAGSAVVDFLNRGPT